MDNSSNAFFASEEDWGTGDAIKIDKSKDAMSTTSWGSIDKTSLLHKAMKAKNYAALVHDVYMKIEAGDYKTNTGLLKYPVMQIIGDTAVYNSGGLSSALGYAEKESENAVVTKVNGIRKKMGLDEPQKEAMSVNESTELEKDKKEEMAAVPEEVEKKEEMAVVVPEEKETPADEQAETPAEQKKEQKKGEEKKMSLDAYVDMTALLAMLIAETEQNREIAEESDDIDFAMCKMAVEEVKKGEFCNGKMAANGMFALVKKMSAKAKLSEEKMCKMAEDVAKKGEEDKAYMAVVMAENEDLKKFKAAVEEKEKMFTVEAVMAQLMASGMPEAELNAVKEEAKMCGYASIGEWEMKSKAKAFNYAVKTTAKPKTEEIVKSALPWYGNTNVEKTGESNDVWDRIKKDVEKK